MPPIGPAGSTTAWMLVELELELEPPAGEHGPCDGGDERHDRHGDEREQAPVGQVGLEVVQELVHGRTLTIAGAVGDAEAPEVEAAGVAEPLARRCGRRWRLADAGST